MQTIRPQIGKNQERFFVLPNRETVKEFLSKMWGQALAKARELQTWSVVHL